MKQFLIAAAAAALISAPAFAALPVGSKAPEFNADAYQAGQPLKFSMSEALKKGPVVLYFFPAAFTSGCTLEAHAFAEATPEFEKLGATVIGVTAGNVDRINEFSVSECRNKFAVAAVDKTIAKSYDASLWFMPSHSNRTSYVIAPDGKIIFAYSALDPDGHVEKSMAAVKAWRDAHP